MKTCGKCKSAYYCTVACQKQAWPEHKKSCKSISEKSVVPLSVSEGKMAPINYSSHLTGYLRFMHIWVDALNYRGKGAHNEVWIAGPGMRIRKGVDSCPQYVEALNLWRDSHFTVFDYNPLVIEGLKSIDQKLPIDLIENMFSINNKLSGCGDEMKVIMRKLKEESSRNNTVDLHRFTMGRDNPNVFPQADVIIATLSLYYPMLEILKTHTDPDGVARADLFMQYASKLKTGGVLYIDRLCLESMLLEQPVELVSNPQLVLSAKKIVEWVHKIREKSGIKLTCGLLPVLLGVNNIGPASVVRQSLSEGEDIRDPVPTTDVYVFKRI